MKQWPLPNVFALYMHLRHQYIAYAQHAVQYPHNAAWRVLTAQTRKRVEVLAAQLERQGVDLKPYRPTFLLPPTTIQQIKRLGDEDSSKN